jgi:hypothetical protein
MPKKLDFEELTDNNWTAILRKLRKTKENSSKGGCVIFLGPEALISNQKKGGKGDFKTMLELLCEKAIEKMKKEENISVECPGSKLTPFIITEAFINAYGGDWEELWNELFDEVYTIENLHPVFHEKFPYIPIPILINTSPDLLIKRLFNEKAGIRGAQFSFYNYKSNSSQRKEDEKLKEPEFDSPIIYNLFGAIDNPNSIVSSPESLLEYVFTMLSRGQVEIDELVREEVKRAKYFIFLGFDFESWHLKLLLRFFNIKKSDNENKVTYARPWNLKNEETMLYFKKLFNVTFVKYNIVDFINELYERCKSNPNIKTRPFSKPGEKVNMEEINTENLKNLLGNSIPETLKILEKYFILTKNDAMRTICIKQIQSFNDLEFKLLKGVITEEAYKVSKNIITDAVYQIIDKINTKD